MVICGSYLSDGRVSFNRRMASMHLRVPVRSLQTVLATARVRVEENEKAQNIWGYWVSAEELDFQIEDHLNDEEYIDLDERRHIDGIDIPGIHIPHVGDIGDMTDTYFNELQRGAGIPDEISEGMVQIDIPFVDTTDEGEKKQSAGSWMKHNI